MNPEIEREQAYVDHAYARLEDMRLRAVRLAAAAAARGAGGTRANLVEREILVDGGLRRAAALDLGDEPLVFGRIDRADGQTYYIGRVAVADEDYHALVVDWRAPVAEAFYRATAWEPMGLVRRRHFICRGRKILAVEDELLAEAERAKDLVLVGEGALLDAMQRSRTGRMRDIVATIQAEQDAVIRAPLTGMLVVQGGPGTGKTAVALHRAAYLLYTHRAQLERSGVLIVGPNPVFLRYIERVLPALGEHAVTLATASWLAGVTATADDSPEAARLKGSARMKRVLSRAVEGFEIPLREPVKFLYDGELFELSAKASERLVSALRGRRRTHNARRPMLVRLVLDVLYEEYRAARRDSGRPPPDAEERLSFVETMLDDAKLRQALDAMWPVLRPQEFLRELFGSRSRLRAVLAGRDATLLHRREHEGWTEADAALLDEAAVLLGPPERRKRARRRQPDEEERWAIERMLDDFEVVDPVLRAERSQLAERLWEERMLLEERPAEDRRSTYGYVLVDEAQDTPPMRWRMLARRCRADAMTVVGDLGQSAATQAPQSWDDVVGAVPVHAPPTVAELSINYRTPAEIMEFAGLVLAASAPGLKPPRSVRRTGTPPAIRRVSRDGLAEAVGAEARRAREGTTAVIAAKAALARVREWTGAPGFDQKGAILDEPVAVFSYDEVKGLEFDSVVVVEPAAIVEEAPGGLRALYVALTRPTSELTIVHSLPLPEALVRPRPARAPSSRGSS